MKALNPTRVAVATVVMLFCFVLLLLLADEAGAQEGADETAAVQTTSEEPTDAEPGPEPAAVEPVASEPAGSESDESAVEDEAAEEPSSEDLVAESSTEDLPSLFVDLPRMIDDSENYHTDEPPRDLHDGSEDGGAVEVAGESTASDIGCGVECHRSRITQKLIDRWWTGSQWAIVIEATLDSNRFCHLFWYHCVVQPAQPLTTSLTLVDVDCLSPHWYDYGDRCVKRGHFAGHDQKFEFSFLVDPSVIVGSVFETVEFWRPSFPCGCKQVLATNTIEVDFDIELDIVKDCPDTVQAGTTGFQCTITVNYPDPTGGAATQGVIVAPGPSLTGIKVKDSAPSAFSPTALTWSGSGTWTCGISPLECADGELDPGQSVVFTVTFNVDPSADGLVTNTGRVDWTVDATPFSKEDSDDVTIYQPSDTTITIVKDSDEVLVLPGQPISWTITITNTGGEGGTNFALNVRVVDHPPSFVNGAAMSHESGVGTWSCSGLECTTAVMPVGTTVFRVSGTVAADTSTPNFVHNEAQVEWDNNIHGPDYPETAGATTFVLSGSVERKPAPAEPTGEQLAVTGNGLTLPLLAIGLLVLLSGVGLRRASLRLT